MNDSKQPARDPIDEIARGFQQSQILLTANRIGLFDLIGKDQWTADRLAQQLNADLRGIRILCDALSAMDLLMKKNDEYSNSELALRYLLSSSPQSKNAILLHNAKLYETWGQLYDSALKGQPADDEKIDPRLKGNEHKFAKAMADVGRISAAETAELLDLSTVHKVLDVGGGPGLYSIEFAKRNPQLKSFIFDDEKTLEIARENIDRAGMSDRVIPIPGNALIDPFPEQYDFILLSNFIHIFSFEDNARVVKKCADALQPGGRIGIKDFILDESRTKPTWSAMFAVNMLVNTEEGDCYTLDDIRKWFNDAGVEFESEMSVSVQSRMIIGRK